MLIEDQERKSPTQVRRLFSIIADEHTMTELLVDIEDQAIAISQPILNDGESVTPETQWETILLDREGFSNLCAALKLFIDNETGAFTAPKGTSNYVN